MITRSTLTRMLSLVIIAIIASTSGFAQEAAPSQPTASPAPATITPFPVTRSVTDSAGRKLEGAILSKDADSIRFRRTSDGKEFDLPLDKLSPVDQSFIATLKAPATTLPPADNKPIKVLYTIPHDAVLVGDFYNLEALGKLGYEVTLTSYKLPPDGWIVNAITGSIPDSEPGQRPANLYTRTNKRLNPALKTILMDTVKTTDYDVLFLSMEKKQYWTAPHTESSQNWKKNSSALKSQF